MKTIVLTQFGAPDVLKVQEVAMPTPKDNEVLIRVRAVSVNFGDTLARNFKAVSPGKFSMPFLLWLPTRLVFGIRKPKVQVLGSEFAGEVAAIGTAVTRYKVGDAVFGYRGQKMGTNAEYLCMPEDGMLTRKPANMTYEEAAAVPYGALTALTLLRKMNIQAGQKVLINGASGGIGSFALQFAKHFGAVVTGVAATPRLRMVQALGADRVIDYTKENFTQSGESYDLIMDILNKVTFGQAKRSLTPRGRLLYTSFKFKQLRQMLWTRLWGRKRVICALSNETPADLALIRDLIEAGTLKVVIDRCFPLENAAEAHRYYEHGAKQGAVVMTV